MSNVCSSAGPGLRGDISPLTPERDAEQPEHYTVSAYAQNFTHGASQMPARGPSGFMPPPPTERTPNYGGRNNTPQMQGNDV